MYCRNSLAFDKKNLALKYRPCSINFLLCKVLGGLDFLLLFIEAYTLRDFKELYCVLYLLYTMYTHVPGEYTQYSVQCMYAQYVNVCCCSSAIESK